MSDNTELDKILAGVGNKYNASCHISEVISEKDAKAAINQLLLKARRDELKTIEPMTHEDRGTIAWEMDAIATHAKDRIAELDNQIKQSGEKNYERNRR